MGKVAAIGRDGRFMVNPSNHSESTTHYNKSYISEGPAVTDGLVLYLDADDWGSYPGTKTLTGKFTEHSSGSSHYRTMGRNGVVLLGTSTSWIGYFSADPSSTGRHTLMFDYWSDVAQSNSLVLDNDGIHDNEYNATLSTQTYRQTRFENFTHTTTGNIKFYFRNNVSGNKVYVDNVRFFKADDTWNDLSGNGYDVTITGATPAIDSTAGLYFGFDGTDDYMSRATKISASQTNMSYGFWINFDSWQSSGEYNQIYCEESAVWIANYYDKIGCDIHNGSAWVDGAGGTNDGLQITVPSAKQTNTWVYIVFVYDGSGSSTSANFRGYIDGEESFNVTTSFSAGAAGNINASGGNIEIGKRNTANFLPADLANVMVYQTSLTAAQVKQNFNSERNRFGV